VVAAAREGGGPPIGSRLQDNPAKKFPLLQAVGVLAGHLAGATGNTEPAVIQKSSFFHWSSRSEEYNSFYRKIKFFILL
jgi:hypothetical protein